MRIIFIDIIVFAALSMILTACTISFQNISTHGMASDLVDESQEATGDVKPNVQLPML